MNYDPRIHELKKMVLSCQGSRHKYHANAQQCYSIRTLSVLLLLDYVSVFILRLLGTLSLERKIALQENKTAKIPGCSG